MTKTCGDCSWFSESGNRCKLHNNQYIFGDRAACKDFKQQPTNGDVIRQMSNAELAKLIVPKVMFCDGCPVKCAEKDIPKLKDNPFGADIVDDVCKQRVEAWLNAPAESEGEDE
jgi:hypothetical protein